MSETKDMCYQCRNFTQYYLKKTDGSFEVNPKVWTKKN